MGRRLVVFAAASSAIVVAYVFLLSIFRGKLGAWSGVPAAAFLAAAMVVLNWQFLRREGWSFATIGFDKLHRIAAGVALGVGIVAAWALIITIVTGADWRRAGALSAGSIAQIFFLSLNNLAEELAYRAYAFLVMWRLWGAIPAMLITSAIFTLLHIQSGIPWTSAIAVVFTSALLYASLFIRSRTVPLVWAAHLAMNVSQEIAGFRRTPLTLIAMHAIQPSALQTTAVLAAIGVLTGAAAVVIFATRQNS